MTDYEKAEFLENVEQIAHKAELSTDCYLTDSGNVEVMIWSGESDMVGYFFEELTAEGYTYEVTADNDRIHVTVKQ